MRVTPASSLLSYIDVAAILSLKRIVGIYFSGRYQYTSTGIVVTTTKINKKFTNNSALSATSG